MAARPKPPATQQTMNFGEAYESPKPAEPEEKRPPADLPELLQHDTRALGYLTRGMTAAGLEPSLGSLLALSWPEVRGLPGVASGTEKALRAALGASELKLQPSRAQRGIELVVGAWQAACLELGRPTGPIGQKRGASQRLDHAAQAIIEAGDIDIDKPEEGERCKGAMLRALRGELGEGEFWRVVTLDDFARRNVAARAFIDIPAAKMSPEDVIAEALRSLREDEQEQPPRPFLKLVEGIG